MGKVLIVDDAKFMRMTIADIINTTEHQIIGEGENGQEAITLYRELNPDLVIMDITMPQLSGLDAMKVILEEDASAKVIICSAMGQQKLVMEAIKLGAKDFIVKPFDEEQVIDAVKRILY